MHKPWYCYRNHPIRHRQNNRQILLIHYIASIDARLCLHDVGTSEDILVEVVEIYIAI